MSKKEEKTYTPQEAAAAVLGKVHELLKKSELIKANTAHEVEAGEEPRNDDAEAPEYLANADIEGSGEKKEKKKEQSEDSDSDEDMEEEAAEESEEEDSEEDEEEEKKPFEKSEDMDKCGDMKEMKKMDPKAAAAKVMGDKDLDDVLRMVPKEKRDDVLRELRSMKKAGKSKKEMMAMCKGHCSDKMDKSETNSVGKVYEFLAKSYMKKKRMEDEEEMSEEYKKKLQAIASKKKKKDKLKKMAGMEQPMKPMKPEMPKQQAAPAPKGGSGTEGY